MPQFVLDLGSATHARTFASLDSFTQGYVKAAMWTEEEHLREEGLEAPSFADIEPETLKRMVADCARFQACRGTDLDKAAEEFGRDLENSGHDFWLTRNHHGVGFWAREMGAVGDSLDSFARSFPSVDLCVGDDGQVYDN